MTRAQNSSHGIYAILTYNGPEVYFNDTKDMVTIRMLLRARAGLLFLNCTRENDQARQCSLCNLKEVEDLYHFLGRCPIIAELRQAYLKKSVLSDLEVRNFLNGVNVNEFSMYLKHAIRYRRDLVSEFN